MYHIDFTRYAGKRIQMAFISSSCKTASNNLIRLAEVSLNRLTTANYQATTCSWDDYEDDNFSISAYDLRVGTTEYQTYMRATKSGENDKYATMHLTVLRDTVISIQATVCEGTHYTDYNFDINNASVSRQYKQKLQGENACDSVVVLDLTVLPRLYTEVHETICHGGYYEFNGVKYYIPTVQTDILSSLTTGCDSIVTLVLTVNGMLNGAEEVHLCPGDAFEFGKFGSITEDGTYVDTIRTATGCDCIATVRIFTHQAQHTLLHSAVCEGEHFDKYNFSGLTASGVYHGRNDLKTIYGCASTVTLHFMVADASRMLRDSIAVNQLPYMLDDEEILPVGTAEGTYTREISLSCGKVTLTITVGEPTGLHSVFANTLAIAPNPVSVGQDIRILGTFAADAVVEVVSTTGARIYYAENVLSPVIIPGIHVAGAYLVTVTSDGQVFQSKLIVR